MRYTNSSSRASVSEGGHDAHAQHGGGGLVQMLKRPHRRVASNERAFKSSAFLRGGKRSVSSASLALPSPSPSSPSVASSVTSSFFPPHSRQSSHVTLHSLSLPPTQPELLTPPAPAFLGQQRRRRVSPPDSSTPSSATFGSEASSSRLSLETAFTDTSVRRGAKTTTEGKGALATIRDAFKGFGRRLTRRGGGGGEDAKEVRHKPLFLVDNSKESQTSVLPRVSVNSSAPCLTLSLAASIDADPFRLEPFGSRPTTPKATRGLGLSSLRSASSSAILQTTASLATPSVLSLNDASLHGGPSLFGAAWKPAQHLKATSPQHEESTDSLDDYGAELIATSKLKPVSTRDSKALYACTVLKLFPQLSSDETKLASPRSINTVTALQGRRSGHALVTTVLCNSVVNLLNSKAYICDELPTRFVAKYLPMYAAPQDVHATVVQRTSTQRQLESRAVPKLQKQLNGGLKEWLERPSFAQRMQSLNKDGEMDIIVASATNLNVSPRCRAMAVPAPLMAGQPQRQSVAAAWSTSPARTRVVSTPNAVSTAALPARMQLSRSAKSSYSASPSSPSTLHEWTTEHDENNPSEDDVPLELLSYRRSRTMSQCLDGATSGSRVAEPTHSSAIEPPRTPIQNTILTTQIRRQREARLQEMEINKKLLAAARARRAQPNGMVTAASTPSPIPSRADLRSESAEASSSARSSLRAHAPSSYKAPLNGIATVRPVLGQRRQSVPASPPPSLSPPNGRASRAASETADPPPPKGKHNMMYGGLPGGSPMLHPNYLTTPQQQQQHLPVGYVWAAPVPMPMQPSYFAPMYTTGVSGTPMYGMPPYVPAAPPTVPTRQRSEQPTRPPHQRHSRSASSLVTPPSSTRQRPVLPYSSHSATPPAKQSSWTHTHPRSSIPSPSPSSSSQPARRSPLAQHVYSR